jgi:hypothetical protein
MADQAALDLEDRRRERRETVAYATVAVFGLLCTTAALIAALSHGIPRWLVIAGYVGGGIVIVPLFAFLWLNIVPAAFSWLVQGPLVTFVTVVRKDEALAIFPTIIGPVQALLFFVSGELLDDKTLKITLGVIVGALSVVGGIFALLAKNRAMYFCGLGAVVLSLIPVVVIAGRYQQWVGLLSGDLLHQIAVIGSLVASIFALIIAAASWRSVGHH